jgi:hypothetical protein
VILTFLSPAPVRAQCADLRINEIDYDQDGTDTAEFIELKGLAGAPLAGLDLHLVNGLTGAIYRTEPLTGTIPADSYLVVGSLGVAEVDIMLGAGGVNLIQNGAPDGAGLWDRENGIYCDFINYEGTISGYEGWPEIGTDTAANCAAGASTSLSRREATLPEGIWVSGACASPGTANESPTALRITALTARVETQSGGSGLALFALSSGVFALYWLRVSRRVVVPQDAKSPQNHSRRS